jgi:hypothetical protein
MEDGLASLAVLGGRSEMQASDGTGYDPCAAGLRQNRKGEDAG